MRTTAKSCDRRSQDVAMDGAKLHLEALPLARFQCIINEYYRNQGISPHIDNLSFGPTIIGISIGADVGMTFDRNTKDSTETFECFLPQRSMMMMTGPARYEWKHSISKCVTYVTPEGKKIKKPDTYRRISLTYRELA